MSGEYSAKCSQRQCNIKLSRDNLGEQKVTESAFFRLSKSLKPKISRILLDLLQTSHCELLGGWNICITYLEHKYSTPNFGAKTFLNNT